MPFTLIIKKNTIERKGKKNEYFFLKVSYVVHKLIAFKKFELFFFS